MIYATPWLGGFQSPGSLEPAGGWKWITGETWDYNNWASGEPNNLASGREDKLEFHGYSSGGTFTGQWNDELSTNILSSGYVVEYSPVPIPPAITLFASTLGLMGVVGWRRKKTA